MALDRRTLRELLARPLLDAQTRRVTVVIAAAGDAARQAVHQVSVGVQGARRQAPDHAIVQLGARPIVIARLPGLATEVHVVAVGPSEENHPVTQQLATRAQAVIAAPDHPRTLANLPTRRAGDDAVGAFGALVEEISQRVMLDHGESAETLNPSDEPAEDIPPSVGVPHCEMSLLSVGGITAVELLTALDQIMAQTRYRRCAHAGGGRDFVLIRGRAGAGLRVMGAQAGSAMDLAVKLTSALSCSVNVATVSADEEVTASGATTTRMEWTLEAVNEGGIAAAFRDNTTLSELRPELPLDERVALHVAGEVVSIEPEREGLPVHYERT